MFPKGGRVLYQRRVVLVFPRRFLEWGLACDHVEKDDADSENIGLAGLVRQLEVNLGAHVVDRADERLRVFVEVRCEDEIRNLQVEVVTGVDVEVFGLKVAMREALVLYRLQSVDELLEVVASDWLWQATCLREYDEKVRLVGWEHEISVHVTSEFNHAGVEALDDIRVVDDIENLFLVLGLIYLCLLLLV